MGVLTAKVTVQRSRFIAAYDPSATSVEQVGAFLRQRQRAVRKASHHCWACRLPADGAPVLEQARDDGEVGRPGHVLLMRMRQRDLVGALVVSRIFGGVKLGAGGVTRAFRAAVDEVIALIP